MRLAIEGFMTSFFLLMLLYLSLGLLSAQVVLNEARDYHTVVAKAIEESYYDEDFIEECIAQAEEDGYTLYVECMRTDTAHCEECNYTQRLHSVTSMNSPLTLSYEFTNSEGGIMDFIVDIPRETTDGVQNMSVYDAVTGEEYIIYYNITMYSGDADLLGTVESYAYAIYDSSYNLLAFHEDGQWDSYLTSNYRTDDIDDYCDVCGGYVISYGKVSHGIITLVYDTEVLVLGVSDTGVFEQAF